MREFNSTKTDIEKVYYQVDDVNLLEGLSIVCIVSFCTFLVARHFINYCEESAKVRKVAATEKVVNYCLRSSDDQILEEGSLLAPNSRGTYPQYGLIESKENIVGEFSI